MVFTTRSARPYLISWLRPWIMGMSFIVNNLLKSQKSFYYIISKSFWKLFKSNFWTNTAAPNICKNWIERIATADKTRLFTTAINCKGWNFPSKVFEWTTPIWMYITVIAVWATYDINKPWNSWKITTRIFLLL